MLKGRDLISVEIEFHTIAPWYLTHLLKSAAAIWEIFRFFLLLDCLLVWLKFNY